MEKREVRQEKIKKQSQHLRGNLSEQLENKKDSFTKPTEELLKCHGIYQEKNRDYEGKANSSTFPTIFMIRSRIPGGRISAKQWLAYDQIATKYGQGSIRITTRQTIQFHWTLKGDLKQTMQDINATLFNTSGGCGDVVRNVMQAPNPLGKKELSLLDPITDLISNHYMVKSNAYDEIWLNGERVNPETEKEPLYGEQYLPRKFKFGITLEGINSIDIYTQDVGIAATLDDENAIDGFFILVGGGQGRSHHAPETFPAHAHVLGWIPNESLLDVTDAIVSIQRDYGDRTNRKHARMKYLIHDRGIEWFRDEVQKRSSVSLEEKKLKDWVYPNYLGYHQMENGKWTLGVHILSGRVMDRTGYFIKTALHSVFTKYDLDCQMTPEQDLILLNIKEADKDEILEIFYKNQVDVSSPSLLYNRALSCVALPTCNLAITESERWLPSLLFEIQKLLDKHKLSEKAPVFRIVGCPNGCCRPYNAELALIGEAPGKGASPSPGSYQIWIGGAPNGTRIAFELVSMVPSSIMMEVFDAIFSLWKNEGNTDENLGDFAVRVSKKKLLKVIKPIMEKK